MSWIVFRVPGGPKIPRSMHFHFFESSPWSRRLEVLSERKKRRARGRHARGEGAVEKQSADKFLYTLLLAEVSFRYGFKHLRSFSLSCFP